MQFALWVTSCVVLLCGYCLCTAVGLSLSIEKQRPSVVVETLRFDSNLTIQQSAATRRQELAAFYKDNYRGGRLPRVKPGHVQYSLLLLPQQPPQHDKDKDTPNRPQNVTIATLRIVSQPWDKDGNPVAGQSGEWLFLRALCVATAHRRQGWALHLVQRALANEYLDRRNKPPVFLLAEPSLTNLYQTAGFVRMMTDTLDVRRNRVPLALRLRLASINKRMARKQRQVDCFAYFHHDYRPRMHILLLQHEREIHSSTGTGQIVVQAANRKDGGDSHDTPAFWQVSQCSWSGRADNGRVQEYLKQLQDEGHCVTLLWNRGSGNVSSFLDYPTANPATTTTFVVLDGTWQEAQTMFRKIPLLPHLPRLSLEARGGPSQYRLRGDYGWKQRFQEKGSTGTRLDASMDDGFSSSSSLLCTVEVVAELFEQSGHVHEGARLRTGLWKLSQSFRGGACKRGNIS